MKLCRELNHFPCFDRRKLLLFVFETALSSYTMPGVFFFKMKRKTSLFPQGWSEINLGTKNISKELNFVKNDRTLQSVATQGIEWFLFVARGAVFRQKVKKIIKWSQTRNACGTRLSRLARKLLSGNFGPKTGKMEKTRQ